MVTKSGSKNDAAVDALIARSGVISRQILKFYRYMRQAGSESNLSPDASRLERIHLKVRHFLSIVRINILADLFYTYYIGGSLTRQDQLTFARIHEMRERAYLLTVVNALLFGIPTAMLYFLVGEGFQILSRVNSFTELPALFAENTSLGIGSISLAVDLFRAFDAVRKKRCWAPFGFLPFVINFPTYIKLASMKVKGASRQLESWDRKSAPSGRRF